MRLSPARPVALFTALCALGAAVTLPLATHAAPPKKGSKATGGTVIHRADLGLTFTLPNGYHQTSEEQRQAIAPEAQFFAIGPKINRESRSSDETFNYHQIMQMFTTTGIVMIPSPLPEGADLATMSPSAEEQLKHSLEAMARRRNATFHVENSARGKVAGEAAYFIAGLSDVPGSELTFRHRTCLLLHDKKLYVFAFITDLEGFPEQAPAFERMLASIKWDQKKG